jgi:YidC/Oxa1 family membrane protein insertase
MSLWSAWLDVIRGTLGVLSTDVGLGLGFGIIVATLLLRTSLLPIAWPNAYRACVRQKKLLKLQPELKALKQRHGNDPQLYMQKISELYRRHQLTMFDGWGVVGALVQLPLLLGMYRALRTVGEGVRFLWVPNLLRPDVALALIAGITTALMMAANPDLPEHVRMLMIILPSVLAIIVALKFSSALAIYWTASNTFSAVQTLALHAVVRRRVRSGVINL